MNLKTQDTGTKIAMWVAGATFLASIVGGGLNKVLFDANTKLETNVQLIELAIGILSEPLPEPNALKTAGGAAETNEKRSQALRTWAVDTINASAEIKFTEEAGQQLIEGTAQLPPPTSADILRLYQLAEDSRATMSDAEAKARILQLIEKSKDMTPEEAEQGLNEIINDY